MKAKTKKYKYIMGFPVVHKMSKREIKQLCKTIGEMGEPYIDPVAAAIGYGPIPSNGRKIW